MSAYDRLPRIALAQMEVLPGQPARNLTRMLELLALARQRGAALVAFPEMSLPGYILGDLWEYDTLVADFAGLGERLREASSGLTVLFGNVAIDRRAIGEHGRLRKFNAVWVASDGRWLARAGLPPGLPPQVHAKTLHPDLNPGDKSAEERFKQIASAFAILGNEEKRKRYDAGEIDASGAEKQPEQPYYRQYAGAQQAHPYQDTGGFADFADMFSEAYGGRSRGGARASMAFPGADVRYHFAVDFLEAARGGKKRITMPDGVVLDLTIPAGLRDGQTLRLKGKGEPGFNGGPPGDAYVLMEVREHPRFTREDDDIRLELPIGIHEAVLGAKVEVPTISGTVNLTVPEGARDGQVLRLRGKGIATAGRAGDQFVRLRIVMPEKIDDELRSFIAEWSKKHAYDARRNWE